MKRRTWMSAALAMLASSRASALLPLPTAEALTRIAFGSCADQSEKQPIWNAVLAYRPDLFIFGGDNVYGDVSSAELRQLKAAYAAARQIDGYMRVRREIPVLAVWDDHDYGANDAGVEFAWKRETKELFLEFWDAPAEDARRARDGTYDATLIGPPGQRVQFLLLDTRWFRSPLKRTDLRGARGRERYVPDDDPTKTMLGDAQWRWLEDRLREPAELRVIVSSIQVLADGHGWERWGNFPRERQRLYDLIGRTAASGVVFLSGDRHLGAFYRETAGTPYPLIEMTSSGITKSYQSREAGPNRIGAILGEVNFGTIEIDWAAPRVTLALRDVNGATQRQLVVTLDELARRG